MNRIEEIKKLKKKSIVQIKELKVKDIVLIKFWDLTQGKAIVKELHEDKMLVKWYSYNSWYKNQYFDNDTLEITKEMLESGEVDQLKLLKRKWENFTYRNMADVYLFPYLAWIIVSRVLFDINCEFVNSFFKCFALVLVIYSIARCVINMYAKRKEVETYGRKI